MSKVVIFPKPKEKLVNTEDLFECMNWRKQSQRIHNELKGINVKAPDCPMYNQVVFELSSDNIIPEKRRFLEKVKLSMDMYRSEKSTCSVEYSMYYLLLYYLGKNEDGPQAYVDDMDIIHLQYTPNVTNNTIIYMLNQLSEKAGSADMSAIGELFDSLS